MPLSADGRAQARTIAEALRSEPFGRIYSSGLSRAAETARLLGEATGTEFVIDDRLQEFDFGHWEGRTWDEVVAAYPHLAGLGPTAAKLYAPEGGESFMQVCERAKSFLADLTGQDFGAAAIVTHAGVLHAIFSVLNLEPPERFTPGGITRIALEAADGAA